MEHSKSLLYCTIRLLCVTQVDVDLITNTTTFYLACGSHDIVESFEKVYATILFVVAYILPLLIISINYIILGRFIMKRRSVVPIREVGTNDEKPGYHTGDDIPMQLPNAKAASTPGQGIPMSPFDRVGLQQPENCSNATLPDEQPVPKGPAEVGKKPETFVKKVSARVIKMLLILVVTFAISRAPYFIMFVREVSSSVSCVEWVQTLRGRWHVARGRGAPFSVGLSMDGMQINRVI